MIPAQRSDIVLVVDDSPDTVRLLTDALDAAGMDVMVALDGEAALRAAARMTPDVILMDAIMPGMDGFETCRQIKLLSGFDAVPVIFMTGLSEPGDSVRGFDVGGADYVTKPIDIDAMLARITVHLGNARKIQIARLALDDADQFLVATNAVGQILWFTPQAYRLLEERFHRTNLVMPADLVDWLRLQATNPVANAPREMIHAEHGLKSRVTFVRETAQGEILFRISDASRQAGTAALRDTFRLTGREAEVASWMAKGKSNRDIAAILSLSPRTIDKHLEGIFLKLGVENRTAAAARIIGVLKE